MNSGAIVLKVLVATWSMFAVVSATDALACNSDGTVDIGEECDLGPGNGGDTCCTALCTIRPAGDVCGASIDACDFAESCTGFSDTCPDNGFVPGPKQCKATVTFPAPDFAPSLTDDMATFLETNTGLVERGSQGAFTMQKGTAKIPKYRNFLADGKTPVPAWAALLLTNDALSAPLEVSWKSPGFKSVYTAGPGEQVIVVIPMTLGKKPISFKMKSSVPAAGTLDFVTLSPSALSFLATDTPRPLLINRAPKKAIDANYTFGNSGLASLWIYNCPTADYDPVDCGTAQIVGAGETGTPLELSVLPGASVWFGADLGFSTQADIAFSERSGTGFATRGCVGC